VKDGVVADGQTSINNLRLVDDIDLVSVYY